jgi:hypothetical protein
MAAVRIKVCGRRIEIMFKFLKVKKLEEEVNKEVWKNTRKKEEI